MQKEIEIRTHRDKIDQLSDLQTTVLDMYIAGKSYNEISNQIELSEPTVSAILKSVVKALDANNLNLAVAIYLQN